MSAEKKGTRRKEERVNLLAKVEEYALVLCVYLGCATLGKVRAQLVTTELIENNSLP